MNRLKLAILGFGNAGQAFAQLILAKKEQIQREYGMDLCVVAITTKSRGCLLDEEGIDLEKACTDLKNQGTFDKAWDCYTLVESIDVAKTVDYDVLIELTPLDIFSGQPAIDHLKSALNRGKNVITANKGPIAWAFKELKELAQAKKALFYYETTVMDGTPIFNLYDETLRMCQVLEVSGILNTTTNFMLEELAKGKNYDEVLTEGKRRGFIEADPTMDIEGYDAAAKLTALLNVLMDANITPPDIDRKGIEDITAEDIEAARVRGNVIKLYCRGRRVDGKIVGEVKPIEVSKADLLSNIDGTSSVVSIVTDLMGKLSIVEHDPEIEQTAYGIFSDLLRTIKNLQHIKSC